MCIFEKAAEAGVHIGVWSPLRRRGRICSHVAQRAVCLGPSLLGAFRGFPFSPFIARTTAGVSVDVCPCWPVPPWGGACSSGPLESGGPSLGVWWGRGLGWAASFLGWRQQVHRLHLPAVRGRLHGEEERGRKHPEEKLRLDLGLVQSARERPPGQVSVRPGPRGPGAGAR